MTPETTIERLEEPPNEQIRITPLRGHGLAGPAMTGPVLSPTVAFGYAAALMAAAVITAALLRHRHQPATAGLASAPLEKGDRP